MLEIATIRKNKISLDDYEYKKDFENRLLLSSLSLEELNVLEELLFSPIKTSIMKLSTDLDISDKQLTKILEKLQKTEFIKVEDQTITIDKKMRKYFEFEYLRFDEDFKPDLVFINNLLTKIPIHILPVWYSLPKTSNNIFQSIIDKYFLTPQTFQRHLEDLENENPVFSGIINDLYTSSDLQLEANKIKKKYDLDNQKYFEYLLLLEYNFVCFQAYKKTQDGYVEILIPFYEYQEYLIHFNKTIVQNISSTAKITKKRKADFAYVEDLSSILLIAKKPVSFLQIENNLKKELSQKEPNFEITETYINNLINKLVQINFLNKKQTLFEITPQAIKWLSLSLDHRALHLYYHPQNIFQDSSINSELLNDKNVREAEKSVSRVVKKGWVYFDDFIKGVMSAITDDSQVKIKSLGKVFRYSIPTYTQEEINFIKKVIFDRLFETAMVNVGFFNGKDCFNVTQLGETLFEIT